MQLSFYALCFFLGCVTARVNWRFAVGVVIAIPIGICALLVALLFWLARWVMG